MNTGNLTQTFTATGKVQTPVGKQGSNCHWQGVAASLTNKESSQPTAPMPSVADHQQRMGATAPLLHAQPTAVCLTQRHHRGSPCCTASDLAPAPPKAQDSQSTLPHQLHQLIIGSTTHSHSAAPALVLPVAASLLLRDWLHSSTTTPPPPLRTRAAPPAVATIQAPQIP